MAHNITVKKVDDDDEAVSNLFLGKQLVLGKQTSISVDHLTRAVGERANTIDWT